MIFLIAALCNIFFAYDQPRGLKIQANCADTCKVIVSWQKNIEPDVMLYTVYRGIRSGEYFKIATVNHPDTSVTIDSLLVNVAYYFAVTAMDTAMNESAYSSEVYFIIEDTTAFNQEIADDFSVYDPSTWRIGSNAANLSMVTNGMLALLSNAKESGWVHTVKKYSLRNRTVDVYFAKTGGSCNVGFSPTLKDWSIDGIASEPDIIRVFIAYVSPTTRGIYLQEKQAGNNKIDTLLVSDARFLTSPVALRLRFSETAMQIFYSFGNGFIPVYLYGVHDIFRAGVFIELAAYYTVAWGDAHVDSFSLKTTEIVQSKYDFNKDGVVDSLDWIFLLRHIGMNSTGPAYRPELDLNSDGWIDGADKATYAKTSKFF